MTTKSPYSYTVLRYVHDVTTGEFVNVGVVLHVPACRFLRVKTRHTIGRVKDAFPDLNRHAFVSAMKAIDGGIASIAKQIESPDLFQPNDDASTIARRALPIDYSSLQWSPVGTGLTDSPDKTFERLFERLVTRYDVHMPSRRTDDDVWRPVREELAKRHIDIALEAKEIVGKTDSIAFSRSWKNGVWHAYEPLSLDLADADGIKDKARRWLGHLSAVADSPSDSFKLSFILGKPKVVTLIPAYEKAKAILAASPGQPQIYEEDQVSSFVDIVEDEYRAHLTAVN